MNTLQYYRKSVMQALNYINTGFTVLVFVANTVLEIVRVDVASEVRAIHERSKTKCKK